jgi:hypothetical protein
MRTKHKAPAGLSLSAWVTRHLRHYREGRNKNNKIRLDII